MQEIAIYGIFVVVLGASLISLIKNNTLATLSNILASSVAFILSLYLLIRPDFHNSWLYVDFVTKVMFVIITMIYLFSSLHANVCMRNIRRFFISPNYGWSLLAGFTLTMLLAVSTPSLGYAWLWLEASTVISATLILMEKEKSHVESAWRYVLIASSGLAIGLFSIILYGEMAGGFTWVNSTISKGALLVGSLALIGFGTKAGLFPMHTWLPDAHGTAPSPVSALLSGALLPSSLIVFYRIYGVMHSLPLFYLTAILGILTIWIASLLMISQKRTKRLFAYSSMDVMGIATVGISLTYFNPSAIYFVLIVFIAHAFGKSALFLSAGTLKRHGKEEISEIRNLIGSSKTLTFAILISALTVTGAPPFAMFFGEFGIFISLISHPWLFFFLISGVLLSFLALNYHVVSMLFSDGEKERIKLSESMVPFGISIASLFLILIIYFWGWNL